MLLYTLMLENCLATSMIHYYAFNNALYFRLCLNDTLFLSRVVNATIPFLTRGTPRVVILFHDDSLFTVFSPRKFYSGRQDATLNSKVENSLYNFVLLILEFSSYL